MQDNPAKLGEIYAETLFELASELDQVEPAVRDMATLRRLLDENTDFAEMLRSPAFAAENRRRVLENVFADRLSEPVLNMLIVANSHGRLRYLPEIIEAFARAYRRWTGLRQVDVTVARPLTPQQQELIRSGMQEVLGGEIELDVTVRPAIIGGVIIRYGEKVIDNSILARLRNAVAAIDRHEMSAL